MGRPPAATVHKQQKLRKGLWSPEEDEKLFNHITTHGVGCWSSVPQQAGLQRCGKSCRLRWINYLRPDIKRGALSQEEEELIIRLHRLLGNRWSRIAERLPGRTDNEIKNFWNTNLKKKLGKQGGVDHPDTRPPYIQDGIPAAVPCDRRRLPIFDPFPAVDDLDCLFLPDYHHTILQPQDLTSSNALIDGHHRQSSYATPGNSNHSCSTVNAAGVGGPDWYVERSIGGDCFQLIHTDCPTLQEDQQGLDISPLIDMPGAGGEFDYESRVRFIFEPPSSHLPTEAYAP